MIVALAGRRIDAENSKLTRFPLANIGIVRERIRDFFVINKVSALVCSGACGSDLLALEVAGELGIHSIMVIPFKKDIFLAKSVSDRPGNWAILFNSIYQNLNKESAVIVLDYSINDRNVYEKTNLEIITRACDIFNKVKKDSAKVKISSVIIWEGQPKETNDTTEHFRQESLKREIEIKEIYTLNT
ncbi:MAG: hypothetical protein JWN78_418 [Bacteroidota bacterium]|nr:hypothetical protein [Bacteroidota bacterium]